MIEDKNHLLAKFVFSSLIV